MRRPYSPASSSSSSARFAAGILVGLVLTLLLYSHLHRFDHSSDQLISQAKEPSLPEAEEVSPTTRYYDWVIERAQLAPDGVERHMITVNGQFPGPTIQGNVGDRISVRVTNRLPVNISHPERQRYSTMMHEVYDVDTDSKVSLHWHGLSMRGNPQADGAHGFTSCALGPGEERTYTFVLHEEDAGTHWWHSHIGMSRSDGLWGSLVVHSRKERQTLLQQTGLQWDEEEIVTFGDHYHKPGAEQISFFMSRYSLGYEPTPDSGLINGRNVFDCARNMVAGIRCDQRRGSYTRLRWSRGKTYRLRLINVGAMAGMTISIDGHRLKVIEADGVLIKPFVARRLTIAPGQRYSVIVDGPDDRRMKSSHPSHFWMRAQMDSRCFNMANPSLNLTTLAVIDYAATMQTAGLIPESNKAADLRSPDWEYPSGRETLPTTEPWPPRPEDGKACHDVHLDLLKPLLDLEDAAPALDLEKGDLKVAITASMPKMERHGLVPMGYMNQSSWRAPTEPILQSYSKGRSVDTSRGQLIFEGGQSRPTTIELIVHNKDEAPHPFHLHGHHFWVMETAESATMVPSIYFDPHGDRSQRYELVGRAKRDTVHIPTLGYAVLRWRMDNPGVWAFHCHVLVHMVSGLAMATVDEPDSIPRLAISPESCPRQLA